MSPSKTTYRIYCFDGERMSVTGDLIQAASDEEATARAEAVCAGLKYEIWDGKRLVATLDAERRSA